MRWSMSCCARSDSGWLVNFESDVKPEPSSVPINPIETSTTTPHTARTRFGRRGANSASRRGPRPEPRRPDLRKEDRFSEEIDILAPDALRWAYGPLEANKPRRPRVGGAK